MQSTRNKNDLAPQAPARQGARLIHFWYKNARPRALPQSLLPAILAVCFAFNTPGFRWWLAALAVLGVGCAHLAANLFDDYFDYRICKTDYRDTLRHEGFRARIGKCLYLASGEATLKQLLCVALSFAAAALVIGGLIFHYRDETILQIAALTALLALSYSGPPLRLSYHGFGELTIGLIFGPLNMLGTYYAACGEISWSLVLVSVPIGLLVMNIVYVHSILDFIPDKKIGKQTLAVLLGRESAMLAVLFIVLFLPYGLIIWGIFAAGLPPAWWLLLLTLPMAISLFRMMSIYIRQPERKFAPQFWMGPMADWRQIKAIGIDWFMIRWLLARNLLAALCLIGMILALAA
ncbi:MAG: prenyltransferase [Azoarcus sp.]|jgi:1,4-dihydroxy-2-naphthoate octaprenyltransferase|nr:prenyltransferase [Azoarcus sp.]